MKNLLTLLFAFFFVIGMTACGGSSSNTETEETESTEMMETSADEAMETEEMEADTTAMEAEMDTTAVE